MSGSETIEVYEIGQGRFWERGGQSTEESAKKTEQYGLKSEENYKNIVSWEKERREFWRQNVSTVHDDVKDEKRESNKIFKKLTIVSQLAFKPDSIIWCAV